MSAVRRAWLAVAACRLILGASVVMIDKATMA
jgi:hypothetical protein